MTVIAVKKWKSFVEIAADQQTTVGHNKLVREKELVWENGNKIFSINGMTAGCAGSVKESSLFRVFCKNHKPSRCSEIAVLEFVVEFISWAKKMDAKFESRNHYILVFGKKVFQITEGLLVKEVKTYAAIGSGAFLALGALYYKKGVKQAVKVAKEFDLYCGGKTQFLTINF